MTPGPVLSFLSSLSIWDWIDLVGLLGVLTGVIGEVCAARRHDEIWETRWGGVLIIGLGLELIALPHHFIEVGELKAQASGAADAAATAMLQVEQLRESNLALAEVGERARESAEKAREDAEKSKKERELAESERLKLEIKLAELQDRFKERKITEDKVNSFVNALTNAPKCSIWVWAPNASGEHFRLAVQFRSMLDKAGFVAKDDLPWDIGFGLKASGGVYLQGAAPVDPRNSDTLVMVLINTDDLKSENTKIADRLRAALVQSKIPIESYALPNVHKGGIILLVPPKNGF